jgi:hypothetical protein
MPWLIGIILVAMAIISIGTVLIIVMREKHEHEEWYIPPAPGSEPATKADESGS